MIARSKTGAVLMFMYPNGVGCSIGLYHQQRWEVRPDGNMVRLTYKTITAKISKAEFEEIFKVVEE